MTEKSTTNTFNDIDSIRKLITKLLNGNTSPADFRLEVMKYNSTTVTRLFRDTFFKFSSDFREKVTDIFKKYFFQSIL